MSTAPFSGASAMGRTEELVPDASAAAASGTITAEGRAVAALPRALARQAQASGF